MEHMAISQDKSMSKGSRFPRRVLVTTAAKRSRQQEKDVEEETLWPIPYGVVVNALT
jgi:hypothetical protein